jgi:hypothetical protein
MATSPVGNTPAVPGGDDALGRVQAAYDKLNQFQAQLTEMQAEQQMKQAANDAVQKGISGVKAMQ